MTLSQIKSHHNIWSSIRRNESVQASKRALGIAERSTVFGYWLAKRNAPPMPSVVGRRAAKGRAMGVGSVLKNSFIRSQISMEKYVPASV
jgi:hypothetical protein